MSASTLRVILLDDHPFYRDGIRSLLDATEKYHVVGDASCLSDALKLVETVHPHLAVVDISLGQQNGLDFVRQVHPRGLPRCIVLSMHTRAHYVSQAFNAGAHAYLSKESASNALLQALDKASRGEYHLDESLSGLLLSDVLVEGGGGASGDSHLDNLTPREREILNLAVKGFSSKEMAEQMQVSAKTVLNHRASLMAKLGLKSSLEFAQYVLQLDNSKS